jgi:hypothetical protein
MASRVEEFHARLGFPVHTKERWIVRGIGGEPNEQWEVLWVNETKTKTIFSARITELGRHG